MAAFIYRCPVTGYNVHLSRDGPTKGAEDAFQPVTRTVCARVHLVNPNTGGLLEIDGWPEGGIEQ
jgi:hypothetical protein